MKVYYDLHIHSVLSPCADELMTPNHIVLMSKIKKLDVIAVTDHNCSRNCRAVATLCQEAGIIFIPGIEVETIEGVHLLTYFRQLETVELFGAWLETHLRSIENNCELFGHQWIMDKDDEIIEEYPWLLLQSASLTCQAVVEKVHELDGAVVAAHVNKLAHNIMTHLGFIPNDLELDGVELNAAIYEKNNHEISSVLTTFHQFVNSDAHDLGLINEPLYYLETEVALNSIFNCLKGGT